MFKSCQRLGDNPRDHDGVFKGLNDAITDVSGVRPESDHLQAPPAASPFKPWKIYPSPPPPRWQFSDERAAIRVDGTAERVNDDVDSQMPGEHPFIFKIDDTGVFHVYETLDGMPRPSSIQI
jgi:AMP deaminase